MSDELSPSIPKTAVLTVPRQRAWLWQPNLIVFVSSACIMVLELVAGRIIAPHVGSSLYTWTSVIGVVLAGISLGNYFGGWLADRWASLRVLGSIYVLAALASVAILWVDQINRVTPEGWPIVAEVVAMTTALFFVPCTILGMISPVVVKLTVSDLAKTGSTVGKIYAAGALGSIVGTFLTGFVLIAWYGTHTIVWGVALLLLTMGLAFILAGRWLTIPIAIVLLAMLSYLAADRNWLRTPCVRETNYYCIKINTDANEGESVRLLVLDHLVHSFVDLNDPTHIVYGYEKMYAEAAQYQAARRGGVAPPLRAAMIGGGGYTFPRYMEAIYPTSEMDVIEIDPGVTQVAFDLLALRADTRLKTFNEDARMYFAQKPTTSYDLVFGDAFNHFSVPYHLTTKEFNDDVRAWLAPGGMYVINIIDGPYGEFIRAYVNTLRQTFRYVYFSPGGDGWRQTLRTTFVIIATDTELDVAALNNFDGGDDDVLLARTLATEEDTKRLLTEAPPVLLTDQYAPVDNMLASVFREELRK
ncbi:MAG: fused MFS/spermidine synthase [Chloroflexi bacterium]|nr:fused MFS/spermidine synthase [Chloroflexota bacterium]